MEIFLEKDLMKGYYKLSKGSKPILFWKSKNIQSSTQKNSIQSNLTVLVSYSKKPK